MTHEKDSLMGQIKKLEAELALGRKELKEATAACTWCVHCGETFDMHTAGPDALYEHIRTCDGHPMRGLEAELENLKAILDSNTEGTMELRERFGAREDESFPVFVDRLAFERARAQELLESTSNQLKRTQDDRDKYRDACQELEDRVVSLRDQRDGYMAQVARTLSLVEEQRYHLGQHLSMGEMGRLDEVRDLLDSDVEFARVQVTGWPVKFDGSECGETDSISFTVEPVPDIHNGDILLLVKAGGTGGAAHPDKDPSEDPE